MSRRIVVEELREPNGDFVRQAGLLLGTPGAILEFGASRLFECEIEGRRSRLGTNGTYDWTTADF